jgi:hypothetical protein
MTDNCQKDKSTHHDPFNISFVTSLPTVYDRYRSDQIEYFVSLLESGLTFVS